MGVGRAGADLMVVGEQPGDREDVEGRPFVGPAGRLLDRALEDAGIEPDRVFRTNVVKHFRWSGTRGKQRIHTSPSRVHVAACGPWLVAELFGGATDGTRRAGRHRRTGVVRLDVPGR